MNKKMKECMSGHALMHTVVGVGIGLLLAVVMPSLAGQTGLWLGLVLVAGGLAADFMRK